LKENEDTASAVKHRNAASVEYRNFNMPWLRIQSQCSYPETTLIAELSEVKV